MTFTLPNLQYSYKEFQQYIDEETMFIHYNKHHKNYIDSLNIIIKNNNIIIDSIEDLIKSLNNIDIEDIEKLKNSAGGHFNHLLFWKNLKLGTKISNDFKKIIEKNFGSIQNFKLRFENISSNHFGSGWVWLIVKRNNILRIVSTNNQDNPLMGKFVSDDYGYPIFGLDLWEHAYYLKYKNDRLSYIKNFWNIINWDEVFNRLKKFHKKFNI
ncbi:Fe-Mn family superoxide dismutase [Buchnera aphidicola (Ceratoglyphina bambusae)]|uniref:Fe-Mn family superoxide dismutase n=1 Tax=Buchnera aphidicola TaxID=9 RepID=UPI0031B7FAB5